MKIKTWIPQAQSYLFITSLTSIFTKHFLYFIPVGIYLLKVDNRTRTTFALQINGLVSI